MNQLGNSSRNTPEGIEQFVNASLLANMRQFRGKTGYISSKYKAIVDMNSQTFERYGGMLFS